MSFFGRFFMILLLVVSIIETATLTGWLALTTVNAILAIVVLFVGLTAEHIVTYVRVNRGQTLPIGRILIVAAVETVSWAGWLALFRLGGGYVALSIGYLFVTLFVGHALEQNTTRNCSNLFTGLLRQEAVDITTIETVIGFVWLILTGVNPFLAAGVLFVGLHLEHVIAAGKRPVCY